MDAALQVDRAHETGRVTVAFEAASRTTRFMSRRRGIFWNFPTNGCDWRSGRTPSASARWRSAPQESRQTIQTLAAQTSSSCVRVFDVNLRAPFYSGEVIQESLELATVMKMNDAEVPLVLGLLGLPAGGSPATTSCGMGAERMLGEFPTLQMVAVTRGGHGSLLVTREEWHEHPGVPVKWLTPSARGMRLLRP